MDSEITRQVMESYAYLDQQTCSFQAQTGLQCPEGCGACCENPEIEATPLELLPLAVELFHRGEADQWMHRVTASDSPELCIFYQPDPCVPGNGRCSVYPWRPTLCRLFGYATVTNRAGEPELAACLHHKRRVPDVVAAAQHAIHDGLAAPNFAEWSHRIASIEPHWGNQRLPINQAFRVALERVGLILQMTGKLP